MVENNKSLSQDFVDKAGEVYNLLYGEGQQKKTYESKAALKSALESLSLDSNADFVQAVKEQSSPTLLMSLNEDNEPMASALSHAFVHPETNIKFMMEFVKQGILSEKETLEILSPLRKALDDTTHNLEVIFEQHQNEEVHDFLKDHKRALEIVDTIVTELSDKLNIDPSTIDNVNDGCEHLNPIDKNSFDIG
ncbi:MAG: hypothetical protein ACRBB3_01515 [Alphaproteobacteria bacterium]